MFGSRRKRGSSNPPLNRNTANPNASLAAAQAFLKSQTSNSALAASAAGAALRSRPTTPVSVADVQTKRMIRRAESTSSMGSSRNGSVRGPPGSMLERRGSNGSMSERTFRAASPSTPVPSAHDAPPVPAIPKSVSYVNGHRRTTSMEAPPTRMVSPPPNLANGRGSSIGPGTTATPPRRNGQRIQSLSSVEELTGQQQPRQRGSVNFSLPTAYRPGSPQQQRELTDPFKQRSQPAAKITSPANQNLVYDPNTRSFLPYSEILAAEERYRVQDAANSPVKKKRRNVAPRATGSHLSEGTMGSKPRGTAVDEIEVKKVAPSAELPAAQVIPTEQSDSLPQISAPQPALPGAKKKKKKVVVESDSESEAASYMPNSSDNDSDYRTGPYNARNGAPLSKKPSIVREDRRREEEEDDTPVKTASTVKQETPRTFSPKPLPRSVAGKSHSKGKSPSPTPDLSGRQDPVLSSEPNRAPPPIPSMLGAPTGLTTNGEQGRVQSVSPARSAHFSTTPESLMVKHNPPGRSISPRKSALKHQPSTPRDLSPMGNASEGSNDLQPPSRKKTVRVSFDETNVVVGEAAGAVTTDSPIAQSPQVAKRNWFSLGGRGKKKESALNEENDDEVMKPRPALPLFGSVRGTNSRREPAEERALVKPAEQTGTDTPLPSVPSSPHMGSKSDDTIETTIGQSSDHMAGFILAQDASARNEANISKSREPLPPQVTSVEGSGYQSDSDSNVSDTNERNADEEPLTTGAIGKIEESNYVATQSNSEAEIEQALEVKQEPEIVQTKPEPITIQNIEDAPLISVTQPTPTLDDTRIKDEWLSMPGGFPSSSASDTEDDEDTPTSTPAPIFVDHRVTEPTPSMIGIAEPYDAPPPDSPAVGTIAESLAARHSTIVEEEDDSDTSGIYSDAAEDLSDLEGDGFMSLDAVVESPVTKNAIPIALRTPPASPTTNLVKQRAYQKSGLSDAANPDMDESWDQAQKYWQGLSAEKKRQLEREAREDTELSDSTVELKPVPKPKKKKKIAAVQSVPAPVIQEPQPQIKHDRTYQIKPGSRAENGRYTPSMKSSMRAEPSPTSSDTHLRKSMRGQGATSPTLSDTQLRKSMRGHGQTPSRSSLREDQASEPRAALQKKNRPVSLPMAGIKSDPDAVSLHIKAITAANAAAESRKVKASPQLRRRGSGDSDSSFKRARPAEVTTFRRSMRPSTEQPSNGRQQSPMTSSRYSLRSLSPTGSTQGRRPFGGSQPPLPQTHMRSSLRGSQDSTPSLRNKKSERTKSPIRIPGFGRSSSAKPARASAPVPPRSSRFADSSDEDEARPTFRSRFNDSSDEDEAPLPPKAGRMRGSMRTAQPIRSIPRPSGVDDGDSSDLPDSDDEKSPIGDIKLTKTRQSPTAATSTNQGAMLASGSIRRSGSGRGAMAPVPTASPRPQNGRRGSFMSILRRKKPDDSSKVRKAEVESAARRDTPLERSKSDLMAVKRQESNTSTLNNRPLSPKLQKRNNSASWPLAPPKPIVEEEKGDRPFTADAADGVVGGESRPNVVSRRFTDSNLGNGNYTVETPTKKKKKFQALRKMFRLDE